MARRIVGKFWKYDGNSLSGDNHERITPSGYSLHTVAMVAAIGDDRNGYGWGDLQGYVTKDEAAQIQVVHHKGDNFGHEVTVKAPKSVWDKAAKVRL